MRALLYMAIARMRAFLRPGDLDADFDEEIEAHLAIAEDEKIRQGLTPQEARRMARVELGGLTQVREMTRGARSVPGLDASWLDVKLGLRMLRKSWRLTLVGGLAMTVVIGIAAGAFSFFDTVLGRALPLDAGDRVVAIQTWDAAARRGRDTLREDFERWRDAVGSVEQVGAYHTVERNLAVAEGPTEPVSIAEMTASGFQLARVPPLLGRPLIEEDEGDGALPVLVIGAEAWRTQFGSDPEIIGRRVRLDDVDHTVVGVMPDDFAFPVNHRFWTPFRAASARSLKDAGREGAIFARLAPGVTLDAAEAELTTIGLMPRAADSETVGQLHPRVVWYTAAFYGDFRQWEVRLLLFLVSLLLIPPCANIAILVYARTVTRQEEFAARSALGASRRRIVGQIFVEVLVLAALAGGVALVLVRLVSAYTQVTIGQSWNGPAPFWMDFGLSFSTVFFVAGLAIFAAVIAGVVPALQATGRMQQAGLRALGSRTGMQLGTTWTVLVVAQVAFSLAALPTAVEMAWGTLRSGILGPGFAAEEFLTARVRVDSATPLNIVDARNERAARVGDLQTELVRQLGAEPGVFAVTRASALPGEEPSSIVEIAGVPAPDGLLSGLRSGHQVNYLHVDERFFDAFGAPLLVGRGFGAGDFEPASITVIVNQTFVQQVVGDGNALGLRVRYLRPIDGDQVAEPERWYEIVEVVANLPANTDAAKMYHPAAPGQVDPARLALRVGPNPANVSGRLREIAAALDTSLLLDEFRPLDAVYRELQRGNNLGAGALAAATLSVLLLSAAGMYALMSFTVSQRRREIGIRSALGAALLLAVYLPIEEMGGWPVPGVLPAAAAFMMVVGLLALAGPARRSLRVDPAEVLRDA